MRDLSGKPRYGRAGVLRGCASISLLALLLGCSNLTGSTAETAPGWPCDIHGSADADCRLMVIHGFERTSDPNVARYRDPSANATITAEVIHGPRGEDGEQRVRSLLDAKRLTLSPVVSWDQAPQTPVGFEVAGLTGTERLPLAELGERTPQQLQFVTYRNPATGSILVLSASGPADRWQQLWPRLAPLFAEVRLTEDF